MAYRRILLLRTDQLGDFVLSIPFFKRIKQEFPHARVDIIVNERNKLLAEALGLFDAVFCAKSSMFSALSSLLGILLKNKYDLAIDLIPGTNHLSSILLLLARAKNKSGYSVGLRKYFLTIKVKPMELNYESDMVLAILSAVAQKRILRDFHHDFSLLKNVIYYAYQQQFVATHNITPAEIVLLVHPGLGAKDPRRYWPVEHYALLVKKILLLHQNIRIIITGQREDNSVAEVIQSAGNSDRVINMVGKTTLAQLISLVDLANTVICPLTGITHLAAALQKPAITLVGPTPVKRWTSPELPYVIVTKNLTCSPCEHLPRCIYEGTPSYLTCMKTLSVDMVLQRLEHNI